MILNRSKMKTLLIYRFLEEYSDEENPLSASKLIDMLGEWGINAERKSIYSDISVLKEIGCDIVTSKGPVSGGYFIASRKFEVPEIILLIDAVTSAGFITPKKTKSLVEKLKSLVSSGQAESLVGQVYVDSAVSKCSNEEIYIIIDHLHEAISRGKKVKFAYRRRSVDVKNMKKHTEKTFIVSPYALIWKDDHYYLICNNEKYDNLMNLRIDRMKKLEITQESRRPVEEVSSYSGEFDAQDYSQTMFNMFSGDKCVVTLRCALKLQEEMLDRFGVSIPLKACDDLNHFETTVEATLSDGFVSWLMQYGSDIKVIQPRELAERVKTKALQICETYE